MKHIVSMKWLLARLYEPDLVIADCRFQLGQPDAGRTAFEQGHISGAVYFDLEQDLSAPVGVHGGRHPLPDPDKLGAVLSKAGIDRTVTVIAYDDQGGAMASRLWWLLRYMGHERVYVMDQGFSHWQQAGFPVSTDNPIRVPRRFVPELQPDMLATVENVRQAIQEGSAQLVDSREPARFEGREEPIDRVAGHIPGARNKFWKELLDDDLRMKKPELLQEHFQDVPKDQPVIVYCGSGVTACPNVLALSEAGYDNVKLYAGSWSDWISYEGNPVATGED
ncbi:sulfurtransferase [Marinicrinis lubricantis]|uniref:Sulfurtransferase n=1 Tax=Marinicrinis lubricantis TaxID=2086470 RepID=A0ABW1IRJ9_9BACL